MKPLGPRDEVYLPDGDSGFVGVNSRLAPHQLPEGIVSNAVNTRFVSGVAEPRLGMVKLPWTNRVMGGFQAVFSWDGSTTDASILNLYALSDGNFLAVGQFDEISGVDRYHVAKFRASPFGLSQEFSIGTVGGPSNTYMFGVAEDSSGNILLGGLFTSIAGTSRTSLAKVTSDGTLISSFNPTIVDSVTPGEPSVEAIVVQSDGKILIAGYFTSVNGVARKDVARLNADGTLDTSFADPVLLPTGAAIDWMELQSNGKVLISGNFTSVNGTARTNVARLNSDGTLDTGFTAAVGSKTFRPIKVQSDGDILIGNTPSAIAARTMICRLNTDGTGDSGFGFAGSGTNSALHTVEGIQILPDGKILVVGLFTTMNGTSRVGVARLNADGTLDTTFDPGLGAPDPNVAGYAWVDRCLYLNSTTYVIAGMFNQYNGQNRHRMALINTDGSLQG